MTYGCKTVSMLALAAALAMSGCSKDKPAADKSGEVPAAAEKPAAEAQAEGPAFASIDEICEKYAKEKQVSWEADGIEYSDDNRTADIEMCIGELDFFTDSPKGEEIQQFLMDSIAEACEGKTSAEWVDCHDKQMMDLGKKAHEMYEASLQD